MLTTKDIVDKTGYLAQLITQSCTYDHDVKRCALKNLRSLYLGCSKNEVEEDLIIIRSTVHSKRNADTVDFVAQKLDEHFRCAYE